MTQASIFPLDSRHIGLTDNGVAIGNKHWIEWPTITHIKEALPHLHQIPKGFKGLGTMIADDPTEDSRCEMIHCRPDPDLFFEPTKVSNSSSSPTSGMTSAAGALGSCSPSWRTQWITVVWWTAVTLSMARNPNPLTENYRDTSPALSGRLWFWIYCINTSIEAPPTEIAK